jgi:hypothetical protein
VAGSADRDHLEQFARTRRGVEGYVEPRTSVTEPTMVLVATDGEWTRRRIPSSKAAFELGHSLGMPVYDVAATGYPSRMREWTARVKAEGRAQAPRPRDL